MSRAGGDGGLATFPTAASRPLRSRKRGAQEASAPHGSVEWRPGRSEQGDEQRRKGPAVRQRGAASGSLRARRRGAGRGSAPHGQRGAASRPLRSRMRAAQEGSALEVHDRPSSGADAELGGNGRRDQAAGLKWRHSPAPGSSSSISTSSGSSVRQGSMRSKTISWIVQSMSMISVILT